MTVSDSSRSSPQGLEVYNDPSDMEKSYPEKAPPVEDPFGNEESGEVRYRVMKWWYVAIPLWS